MRQSTERYDGLDEHLVKIIGNYPREAINQIDEALKIKKPENTLPPRFGSITSLSQIIIDHVALYLNAHLTFPR